MDELITTNRSRDFRQKSTNCKSANLPAVVNDAMGIHEISLLFCEDILGDITVCFMMKPTCLICYDRLVMVENKCSCMLRISSD